ncbi:MAG: hypothetical protein ACFFB3_16325 [Candidatus Hodarchaeota archaeon]
MDFQISINSKILNLQELDDLLKSPLLQKQKNINIEISRGKSEYRSIPGPILISIIGAGGAAIGALIAGLLQIVKQSLTKTIVLETRDRRLEVPASTTSEELDILIKKLEMMDDQRVNIKII